MKTTKLKQQNAITLVALIITIIVLLILAMVSISLVMNSGIITKSKDSVDKYSAEEITEQLKLAYSEYQMGQYSGETKTAKDFITERLQETFGDKLDANSVSVADGKVTAKINGTTYEYNTATGTAGEKDLSIGTQITKDNYGDYIDLGQDVIKTNATTDDWRILYNDKNGHVYAILADYLPNTNQAVTSSGLNTAYTYGAYSNTTDIVLEDGLNSSTAWQTLITVILRDKAQVKGATSSDILLASYNEKNNVEPEKKFSKFYIDDDNTKGIDLLYMPSHPYKCDGYWLTSRGSWGSFYYVNYDGTLKTIGNRTGTNGVRPVVSLPSNLQVTNNGGVWSLVNN